MKLTSIKVGKWYQTNIGIGECLKVGGTWPVTVQIRIVYPVPRGIINVRPRDVKEETEVNKKDQHK